MDQVETAPQRATLLWPDERRVVIRRVPAVFAALAPRACPAWKPLPDAVDAVHVVALLTRVRAARIAGGEISAARLYNVRAFRSAIAELGYLRARWAGRP